MSRGQPCDFSGAHRDYAHLQEAGGIQWPYAPPDGAALAQERRLFADGRFFTPNGRARFVFAEPRPAPEPPDAEFPFILLTGRGTSAQWHTQTRTAKSAVLRKLYPERIYVELHPDDAKRLGLAAGDAVEGALRRGVLRAAALPTASHPAGPWVFLPMHYPETNRLDALVCVDPHSRQPAYKACAVSLRPVRRSSPP